MTKSDSYQVKIFPKLTATHRRCARKHTLPYRAFNNN